MGFLCQRHLSLGRYGYQLCEGNVLQLTLLLLWSREEAERPPLAEPCHLGQSHRTCRTGCCHRRELLAGQRLFLQPLLGLPERQEAQLARHQRLCANGASDVGLEHQRPFQADHYADRTLLDVQEHQAQLQQQREPTARLLEKPAVKLL